jgi:hypothetical protein
MLTESSKHAIFVEVVFRKEVIWPFVDFMKIKEEQF